MRTVVSLTCFLLGFLLTIAANGHPVSYKDAFGIMSYNNSKMTEILLTYSLRTDFAVATTYLRDSKSEMYIPRLNYLVKRWNNLDSQGNFYLSAGAGTEKFSSKNYGVQLAEVVADWEDRKYYTYLEHLYLSRNNEENLLIPEKYYNHTKLRLGFAPFLADYKDLNVWFITQFDKHKQADQIEAMQFLRFFIKNILWEVGAGFNGDFAFNFMIHI